MNKDSIKLTITIKDLIASCLVISLGVILIVHFALFWIYGGVFIYESNKVILLLETVMSIAIFGFGIERLINISNSNRNTEDRHRNPGIMENQRLLTSTDLDLRNEGAVTITAETMLPEVTDSINKEIFSFQSWDEILDRLAVTHDYQEDRLERSNHIGAR